MKARITFHYGGIESIPISRLIELLADVDKRLVDPINGRSYFLGYEDLADRFVEKGRVMYALYESEILAGCAVIYADPTEYSHAYETYMGVRGNFERLGIGRKLTEMEFELCREIGMHRIITNCHKKNAAKRALNLACGYSEVKDPNQIASYVASNQKWEGKIFYVRGL